MRFLLICFLAFFLPECLLAQFPRVQAEDEVRTGPSRFSVGVEAGVNRVFLALDPQPNNISLESVFSFSQRALVEFHLNPSFSVISGLGYTRKMSELSFTEDDTLYTLTPELHYGQWPLYLQYTRLQSSGLPSFFFQGGGDLNVLAVGRIRQETDQYDQRISLEYYDNYLPIEVALGVAGGLYYDLADRVRVQLKAKVFTGTNFQSGWLSGFSTFHSGWEGLLGFKFRL